MGRTGVLHMRILRLKEVIHLTGLSKSTIYDRMQTGDFPKAVPLGGRIVGWSDEEINGWIQSKIESSNRTMVA